MLLGVRANGLGLAVGLVLSEGGGFEEEAVAGMLVESTLGAGIPSFAVMLGARANGLERFESGAAGRAATSEGAD